MIPYGNTKTVFTEFISRTLAPAESPVESLGQDHSNCRRTFFTFWNSRQQAYQDFSDWCFLAGADGTGYGGYISRHNPMPYPDIVGISGAVSSPLSGKPFMYCTKIDPVQGWGVPGKQPISMLNPGQVAGPLGGTQIAAFYYAKMTLHFETLPWDVYNDDEMIGAGCVFNGQPDEASLLRNMIREFTPNPMTITLQGAANPMKIVNTGNPPSSAGDVPNSCDSMGDGPSARALFINPPKIIPRFNVRLTHVNLNENMVQTQFINRAMGAKQNPGSH